MKLEFYHKALSYLHKQKMPDVTFKEFWENPDLYPDVLEMFRETILLMKMLKREAEK